MRSMIVDDDEMGRMMLATLLEEFGPCDQAANGRARRTAQRGPERGGGLGDGRRKVFPVHVMPPASSLRCVAPSRARTSATS